MPHGPERDAQGRRERPPAAGWTPTWSPGPGGRQTGLDEEEYVTAISARGPQTAPWRNRDGEIVPGERITPEARAAGWQDTVAHPVAAHVRPRH